MVKGSLSLSRGEFLKNFFASPKSVRVATNLAPKFNLVDFLVRKSTHIYQISRNQKKEVFITFLRPPRFLNQWPRPLGKALFFNCKIFTLVSLIVPQPPVWRWHFQASNLKCETRMNEVQSKGGRFPYFHLIPLK